MQNTAGTGLQRQGCALRASSKQDHRQSGAEQVGSGDSEVGGHSPRRCSDKGKGRERKFPLSVLPSFPEPRQQNGVWLYNPSESLSSRPGNPQILTIGPGGPGEPLMPGGPCKGSQGIWMKRLRPTAP